MVTRRWITRDLVMYYNRYQLTPARAGIIPYIYRNGQLYFCLGVDRGSGDLTDFGGGVKATENAIQGAIREFQEETLGVFGDLDTTRLLHSTWVSTPQMLILFAEIHTDPQIANNLFQERVALIPEPEVSALVWLSYTDLIQIVQKNTPTRIYNRVRYLLRRVLPRSQLIK